MPHPVEVGWMPEEHLVHMQGHAGLAKKYMHVHCQSAAMIYVYNSSLLD
jgi:hypothetical protein